MNAVMPVVSAPVPPPAPAPAPAPAAAAPETATVDKARTDDANGHRGDFAQVYSNAKSAAHADTDKPAAPAKSKAAAQKDKSDSSATDDPLHLVNASHSLNASVVSVPPAQAASAARTAATDATTALAAVATAAKGAAGASTATASATSLASTLLAGNATGAALVPGGASALSGPGRTTLPTLAGAAPMAGQPAATATTAPLAADPASAGLTPLAPASAAATTPPADALSAVLAQISAATTASTTASQAATATQPQAVANATSPPDFSAAIATQTSNLATAIAQATAVSGTVSSLQRTTNRDSGSALDTLDPSAAATGATALPAAVQQPASIAAVEPKSAPLPVGDAQAFSDALGNRLSWMAERQIGHAQLSISPPSLGALDVRLRVDGERVSAQFASQSAEVRQTINDHLPRLRDMLSNSGFTLTDAHVGHGQSQQAQTAPTRFDAPSASDDDSLAPVVTTVRLAPTHDGLLDEFA